MQIVRSGGRAAAAREVAALGRGVGARAGSAEMGPGERVEEPAVAGVEVGTRGGAGVLRDGGGRGLARGL